MASWIDAQREQFNSMNEEFMKTHNLIKQAKEGTEVQYFRDLEIATIKAIHRGAQFAPQNIAIDEGIDSSTIYGRRYGRVWLYAYRDKLSDYSWFWLLVNLYNAAEAGTFRQKDVISLKRIRPADYLQYLDASLADTDPLSVYRGGDGTQAEQRTRISWTTDPATAEQFYEIAKDEGKRAHIWKAKIYKDKIIATYNGREEHEILQHCGVFDIEEEQQQDEEQEAR